jgi:hypothetical protein
VVILLFTIAASAIKISHSAFLLWFAAVGKTEFIVSVRSQMSDTTGGF